MSFFIRNNQEPGKLKRKVLLTFLIFKFVFEVRNYYAYIIHRNIDNNGN